MKKTALTLTLIVALSVSVLAGFALFSTAASEVPQPQWSATYKRVSTYVPWDNSAASSIDEGRSVVQTADGGYAIVGTWDDHGYAPHTGGVDNYTGVIIRTSSSGAVQWKKELITSNNRIYPQSIILANDSGFVINTASQLLKTDAEGNVQWSKLLSTPDSSEWYHDVIQTSDGGYLLVGYNDQDVYGSILKLNENGSQLWKRVFSLSQGRELFPYVTIETSDASYAVAGNWNGHFWFAKLYSNGDLRWNHTYTFPGDNGGEFRSIIKIGDGGFLLAGGDGHSGWLVKTDSEGNAQWNHHYLAGPRSSYFASVVQANDGGYLAAGTFDYYSAWLVKTDASGNLEWNATYGSEREPSYKFSSAILTDDGGYAVVGSFNDSIWLAKFAPESAFLGIPNTSVWVAVIIVVAVVIVGVSLLVYFKKRKR